MPIKHQCQSGANTLPIIYQSHVNTLPIICQSTVNPSPIHCQSSPNAVQIHCQSMSIQIHIDANTLPIQCQFPVNSGQPTSNAAQIRPIYQSDFPMPICDQSANPGQICQLIPFIPIHCRTNGNPDPSDNQSVVNPVPTQFQSSANLGQSSANTTPLRHQSGGHLGQSIANPVPFQCQS